MDSARSGQYCLGSVTAVAIAVVLGCLVAGPYVPKVCLNKLDHPLRQADLFSNPSTSLRPFCPEIRSPPTHLHCHSTPTPPPTEQPSCLQIQIQQAQLFWALTRWAHPPPRATTSRHIIYHRRRDSNKSFGPPVRSPSTASSFLLQPPQGAVPPPACKRLRRLYWPSTTSSSSSSPLCLSNL
jgi:hypothetical protein